jgi:hydrogenase-4 component B
MSLLLTLVTTFIAGAGAALALRGALARWAVAILAAAGSVCGAAAGLDVLRGGGDLVVSASSGPGFLALSFRLDPLGAIFLCLIGLVAAPAAIYGAGYTRGQGARPHESRLMGAMICLFILSMILVVMAADVFTFLFFWEAMSVASYFLVVAESRNPESIGAGRWYAGMAHAGFGLIAAALLLLGAATPDAAFAAMREVGPALAPHTRNAIFLLALIGFASKAGLVPLHVWLPRAHPAAPSHVSALMSGVMLNLGVYGILRVGLDLLGGGPAWWGGALLVMGAVSALKGVLYALVENDLKRLLAYSSVENLGIVSMGVGLGLLFHSYGLGLLAALAIVAGLFHAVNHAAFKGLLFLGAGAVLRATGTRNMEEMGGLIKRMPQTAACFLVGSAAIAALPPLNGFASEWMIFQSLLGGVSVPRPLVAGSMAIAAGALALTGGLAAACFVKAFGISFLALPRSPAAGEAREAPGSMRLAMLALVAACLILGVMPAAATRLIAGALARLPGVDATQVAFHFGLALEGPGGASRMSPPVLAACLVIACLAVPIGLRILGAGRRVRLGETWGCGRVRSTPRMEYTSTAFAEPLRRVFAGLYRATGDLTIGFHPESKYFVRSIEYRSRVRHWFEEYLYQPLFKLVRPLGGSGRLIQSGSVNLYVGYIVAALLAFLLLARWL